MGIACWSFREGFRSLAESGNSPFAAIRHEERPIWGVQFHPEVAHTDGGATMLRNFVRGACGCEESWTMDAFIEESVARIREQVGGSKVVCGLSGGVDSSVAAALVHRAIGDQLTCIFVDHGLMRHNEARGSRADFWRQPRRAAHFRRCLGAFPHGSKRASRTRKRSAKPSDVCLSRSSTKSRRRIGGADYLVQGTLYPDVIESVSVKGPSATIKTHHNVGGASGADETEAHRAVA